MSTDPKARFSDRVEDYIKYRPGYPLQTLRLLIDACGLTPEAVVADIGSGTGILTRLFLDHGNAVFAVEPNREMREAAQQMLSVYPRFSSLDGSAENTGLPERSVDMIVAGQAFHWFDRPGARDEWMRVLKPGGWAVLIWNDRRVDRTPFLVQYEQLLQEFGRDYREVNHKHVQDLAVIEAFMGGEVRLARFDNAQLFDLEGLIGRAASSSYCPARGTPRFEALVEKLRELFADCAEDGRVVFEYDTLVYYGKMV